MTFPWRDPEPANPVSMHELSQENAVPDVGSSVVSLNMPSFRKLVRDMRGKQIKFSIRISEELMDRLEKIALFNQIRAKGQAKRMLIEGIQRYERRSDFKDFLNSNEEKNKLRAIKKWWFLFNQYIDSEPVKNKLEEILENEEGQIEIRERLNRIDFER